MDHFVLIALKFCNYLFDKHMKLCRCLFSVSVMVYLGIISGGLPLQFYLHTVMYFRL